MVYFCGFILAVLIIWCIQDIVLKLIILTSGVECRGEIEKFQEHLTRSASMSGSDNIRFRAVIKYTDLYGREHKVISARSYEKWESECLLGKEVALRYYRRDPEKYIMDKKELIGPVVILVIALLIPVLYLLANAFIFYRFLQSFLG